MFIKTKASLYYENQNDFRSRIAPQWKKPAVSNPPRERLAGVSEKPDQKFVSQIQYHPFCRRASQKIAKQRAAL
jgi:hypothetical protein